MARLPGEERLVAALLHMTPKGAAANCMGTGCRRVKWGVLWIRWIMAFEVGLRTPQPFGLFQGYCGCCREWGHKRAECPLRAP